MAECAVCGSVSEVDHRGLGLTTQASVTRALTGSVSGPACGTRGSVAPGAEIYVHASGSVSGWWGKWCVRGAIQFAL